LALGARSFRAKQRWKYAQHPWIVFDMSKENESEPKKRKKLSFEDFRKVMTEEQMAAFASASRIKYGTAQPEDYAIVAKHLRQLDVKTRARRQ
jgi:hypothetical protein